MLAYRTVQYPQLENVTVSGAAKDHQIGQRFHVTYLNAAGREVRQSSINIWHGQCVVQLFWGCSWLPGWYSRAPCLHDVCLQPSCCGDRKTREHACRCSLFRMLNQHRWIACPGGARACTGLNC